MANRLDPATWPERVQTAALLFVVGGAFATSLVSPAISGRLLWLYVPVVGALIWRFERASPREIASWTVPLGAGLLVAERLPPPIDTLLSALGVGALIAMMYWDKARNGWLHLVAPGADRVYNAPDRAIAERLDELDGEARRAIEAFTVDSNDASLIRRLDYVTVRARAMSVADPDWARLRDLFVGWLAACSAIAGDRFAGSEAFDEMNRRRDAFETSRAALVDARSHPL